jgi:hypothetical protein
MAHFAELDADNIVLRVIVIGNDDCLDGDGNESETVGIAFCHTLFGADTNWAQTSYNTNKGVHTLGGTPFRHTYAFPSLQFDAERDAFIDPVSPYPSWTLNESNYCWEAPTPRPVGLSVEDWDEDAQAWVE